MKRIIRTMTIADRLLLVVLIFAGTAGFYFSREAMSHGGDVIVEVGGKPAYTFPLGEDRQFRVAGPMGDAVIEIKGRMVRVKAANCPNQLCVKEGWVSHGMIVCMPNRMVVYIGGNDAQTSTDVDAVTR